tara:strand:+ start:164 stop:409 length:246 start_codon:yes stop_codon:yes gene_type:complete
MKNIDDNIKIVFIKHFKIKNKKTLSYKIKVSEIPGFDSIGWAIIVTSLEAKFNTEFNLSEFSGNETLREFINIVKKQIKNV